MAGDKLALNSIGGASVPGLGAGAVSNCGADTRCGNVTPEHPK